jgi:hypothetical protein
LKAITHSSLLLIILIITARAVQFYVPFFILCAFRSPFQPLFEQANFQDLSIFSISIPILPTSFLKDLFILLFYHICLLFHDIYAGKFKIGFSVSQGLFYNLLFAASKYCFQALFFRFISFFVLTFF